MPRRKDKTLSIRTTDTIKNLLRLAAAQERRSVASMVEILVLAYASEHNLKAKPVATIRAIPSSRVRLK